MALSDWASPIIAAAAGLGGAFVGGRASVQAQRETTRRSAQLDLEERAREQVAAARLLQVELIESVAVLAYYTERRHRPILTEDPTASWRKLSGVLARHVDIATWDAVYRSYSTLEGMVRSEASRPASADSLSDDEAAAFADSMKRIRAGAEALAPIVKRSLPDASVGPPPRDPPWLR
jgi:hypothetical protein